MLDREAAVTFARQYLACGHASDAAMFSGMVLLEKPPTGCPYVYILLTPDLSRILYVGKGRNGRAFQHVRDVKAGRICGVKKHHAILAKIKEGNEPVVRVLGRCGTDAEALAVERAVIRTIGIDRLANGDRGRVTPVERWTAMRERIKPFDVWRAEKPRSLAARVIYRAIVAQIDRAITDPIARATEIEIVNGKVRITQEA